MRSSRYPKQNDQDAEAEAQLEHLRPENTDLAHLQALLTGCLTHQRNPQQQLELGTHLLPHPRHHCRLLPLQVAQSQTPQNHPPRMVRKGRGDPHPARKVPLAPPRKHAESRNKWKYISEELYSLNPNILKIYRHPKQCREHYASFLDPQIKKGPWTKE